ncbi:uncharacterized protein LOC143255685 isoform X2 [Tachypleus tridentatus]|uniref:uncharacterized protein LOC143255685 isoform X2 n=1 Tax=Tachypleus tridentatus TaxID=6853 RepID=UPI003FD05D31
MKQSSRSAYYSCSTPCPSGRKYICVSLLSKERLYFIVDVTSKGQELFLQVCNYLGFTETKLFGLALLINGEFIFIDQNIKLAKYAPKGWKSHSGSGVNSVGVPYLTLHLRVQFYIDSHLLISDKVARHHYFLQLRENVLRYCHSVADDRAFIIAAYALQADFGNLNKEKHQGRYFEPSVYFPSWIIERLGEDYIIQHLPMMHQDNRSLSKLEAEAGYIREASDPKTPHNMHLYCMKRKKAKFYDNIWLGICCKGIELYEESLGITKRHLSTFPWPEIIKLHFDKRKFEIRTAGQHKSRKFIYYGGSEEMTRNILFLSKLTHQFSMVIQPKLQELKKLNIDEKEKTYVESYIYCDSMDLAMEQGKAESVNYLGNNPRAGSSGSNQPVSIISSLSSNTTSGIISDKVQSLGESEELDYSHSSIRNGSCHIPNKPPRSKSNPNTHLCATVQQLNSLSGSDCDTCERLSSSGTEGVPVKHIKSKDILSNKTQKSLHRTRLKHCLISQLFSNLFPRLKTNTRCDVPIHPSMPIEDHCAIPNHQSTVLAVNTDFVYSSRESDEGRETTSTMGDLNLVKAGNPTRNISTANRCVTRIGVSSLTRTQKQPMSLFMGRGYGMGLAESEPNLYSSHLWSSFSPMSPVSVGCYHTEGCFRKLSSQQPLYCLDNSTVPTEHNNKQCHTTTGECPFVPPPPGYRNSWGSLQISQNCELSSNSSQLTVSQENISDQVSSCNLPQHQRLVQDYYYTTQTHHDLSQLGKSSHRLDFPFIARYFNDRSLLMLPKTVPTCSRQRHLGSGKDLRRFSCSCESSLLKADDRLNSHDDLSNHSQSASRPLSWHVLMRN